MSYDDWLTTPPPMESAPDLDEEDYDGNWMARFNSILARHHGLQFMDLPDEDQESIEEMAGNGFTPDEAYDVVQEVSDVE